jgi:predicted acetyltransferase
MVDVQLVALVDSKQTGAAMRDYGPHQSDVELEQFAGILSAAFEVSPDRCMPWFDKAGRDNVRLVRDERGVVGGLLLLPMGQYFGGCSVATTGVAGVGVAQSARGHGTATRLMTQAMRELRRRGVPLSTLYPATVPLYRRAGYEIAGGRYGTTVAVRDLPRTTAELPVRALEAGDERRVAKLYRSYAIQRNGWLDRREYIWERTRRAQKGSEARGYLLGADDRPEGYLVLRQHAQGKDYRLEVTDLAACTPRGARSVLGLMSSHRSLAIEATWYGGCDEPLQNLIAERGLQVRLEDHWMLRIVDLPKALSERGYPRALDTSVVFEVRDDVIRQNQGRWALSVSAGRGVVKPTKRRGLRLDVRALAQLYSGFQSPAALALIGRIEGGAAMLGRAAALFAGPPPSMPDDF